MNTTTDVLVVGLGAFGSAVTYQAALRGMSVIGIDQHIPPHNLGSTHGQTRITRLAIGEGEEYVPLVRRSHEIWRSLERKSGERLLTQCGGLIVGKMAGRAGQHGVDNFLRSTINAADQHGIDYRTLSNEALRREFPQFHWRGDECGYFEYEAGWVRPEVCVMTQLQLASRLGAGLRFQHRAISIDPLDDGLAVKTDRGTFRARKVVLACGPWMYQFLEGEARAASKVYRQTQFWFRPRESRDLFQRGRFPVFIWVGAQESDLLYGFPPTGPGGPLKVASESFESATTPDEREFAVSRREIDEMRHRVAEQLPDLAGECAAASSCLYTCTPDFRFRIDEHERSSACLVVSPCSGHGFKHSAAIGEAVAEWCESGALPEVLRPFQRRT